MDTGKTYRGPGATLEKSSEGENKGTFGGEMKDAIKKSGDSKTNDFGEGYRGPGADVK